MESFALHEHTEYLEECANILNEEWPRSTTARVHGLKKSSNDLPYCMVLIDKHSDADVKVIGHSKLSRVQDDAGSCFVESVIVPRCLRGRGLGRKVMDETESHARRLGFHTIYLTTHDKKEFYGHLGYEVCEPVVSLGGASSLLNQDQLQRLLGSPTSASSERGKERGLAPSSHLDEHLAVPPPSSAIQVLPPPPPPSLPPPPPPLFSPPPPPPLSGPGSLSPTNPFASSKTEAIVWMRKHIV